MIRANADSARPLARLGARGLAGEATKARGHAEVGLC